MTAADVRAYRHARDGGVEAVATMGAGVRDWAAAPEEAVTTVTPGTINVVVALPVALTDAALVNAVTTATEAKVQALLDAGHDCSGTPTNAVCIAARTPGTDDEAVSFAGPRSPWGGRVARASPRPCAVRLGRDVAPRVGA
nr:adenosylcobinamide amidohydrolase [Streptomyces antibioticus]